MRICTPDEVDSAALHTFLQRFFGSRKADFLDRHGAWWHGGQEHRLILEKGGTIVAYCAVMPARIQLDAQILSALWWLDLMVDPDFRKQGLQKILNREVRQQTQLMLGFPNAVSAGIFLRHGWGVRDNLRVMLAPLDPPRVGPVLRATGSRGMALRATARALTPLTSLWRRRLSRYVASGARRIAEPDLDRWAELARGMPETTTVRDAAYLRRRYLDAPYRDEFRFYESETQALIVRRWTRLGRAEERILDLFGDLKNRKTLEDLLRCALRDSARGGTSQVTALVGTRELARVFRKSGFPFSGTGRFCWSSPDPGLMSALQHARLHWTLGDSDNDDPA